MTKKKSISEKETSINNIDDDLSRRFIDLDQKGYFLIKINKLSNELIVEHFDNNIDERGRALDPETGKIITCAGTEKRAPTKVFTGRTAKEIGIKITEEEFPVPIGKIDHALYLGRELQKAEYCLVNGTQYIQD